MQCNAMQCKAMQSRAEQSSNSVLVRAAADPGGGLHRIRHRRGAAQHRIHLVLFLGSPSSSSTLATSTPVSAPPLLRGSVH